MTPQIYVTSIGPLQVVFDPNVTIFNPVALSNGAVIEPIPVQGGLAVRTINGRAVPFEARGAALEAMEAHCLDQPTHQIPLFFGWRESGDEGVWSSAGCDDAIDDLTAHSGAE